MTRAPNMASALAALKPSQLHAELLRRSFWKFCSWAWPLITGAPLVANGAINALIQALQDVADGKINKLLVAMPPGVGKSTVLACYAAWRLVRNPAHKSIHASHAFGLASTESRRVRRLVESDEYRKLFPVRLRQDESTVEHWATEQDGRYYAVGAPASALTGRRASEAVLDDPLNAVDRFSKAARDALWAWFQEGLLTRLDGDNAPVIVVQQRLDRDDLIGKLIALGGYTLLELPAIRDDGSLLAPNVLSQDKLDDLKRQIGSAAFQTAYQQRPFDDGASLFKCAWLTRRWTELPDHGIDVIALDATFKAGDSSDYAVIQHWRAIGGDRYLVEQWRRQAGFADTLAALKEMAERHPLARIVVELAANGHAIVDQLRREVPGVIGVKPVGSKVARAASVQAIVESGAIVLPANAPWVDEFIDEVTVFTAEGSGALHDDQVDAMVWGLRECALADDLDDAPACGHVIGERDDNIPERYRGEVRAVPWAADADFRNSSHGRPRY